MRLIFLFFDGNLLLKGHVSYTNGTWDAEFNGSVCLVFGDLESHMALARLLKGALLWLNGQMKQVENFFEKISKFFFQIFFKNVDNSKKFKFFEKCRETELSLFDVNLLLERACFLKAALLANGQFDISPILPLPHATYNCYLGSLVQWKWLIVNSTSLLCLLWPVYVSWMHPFYEPVVKWR